MNLVYELVIYFRKSLYSKNDKMWHYATTVYSPDLINATNSQSKYGTKMELKLNIKTNLITHFLRESKDGACKQVLLNNINHTRN